MIVSDASPLIVLLKTNKLSILKEMFEIVIVPTAVYKEITIKEQEKAIFDNIKWIKTKKIESNELKIFLEKLVDRGEAEAIILAKELKMGLIVDDAKARKYARHLNVEVIGTLGLLKTAKNRGVITSVQESINDMLAAGYYIEDNLIAKLLEDVGES